MPMNTTVEIGGRKIYGTVELGVKGERGLQGFKGDQGIQGPPVPVAHELGDDPDLAVSQKLLTDSIADMEQSNEAAVIEATRQAGLAGESATVATEQAGIAAIRAGEAAQSAQAASVSALAAGQYASTATEQAGIAAVKAGEASSSAADAAIKAGLAADSEAAAEQAVDNVVIAADRAENAADRAEAARDATFVYPDVATGLAAVAVGEQFQVVEGDILVRYRKDSEALATPLSRMPSADLVFRAQEESSNGFGNGVYNDTVISSRRPSTQNLTSPGVPPTFEYLPSPSGMVLDVSGSGSNQILFSTDLVNLRANSRTVLKFRINSTTSPSTVTALGVSFAGTVYFWHSNPGEVSSHLRKRVGTGTPVQITRGIKSSQVLAGDTLTVEFILNSSGDLEIAFNNGRDTIRYKDSGITEGPIGIVSNTGINFSVSASRESVSPLATSQLDDVKLNQSLAVFGDYRVAELPLITTPHPGTAGPNFSAKHALGGLEIELNNAGVSVWFDTDLKKPIGGLSGTSTQVINEIPLPKAGGRAYGLVFGNTAYYWYSQGVTSSIRKKVSSLPAETLTSFAKEDQAGDVLNISFSWDGSGNIELEFKLGPYSYKFTDVCDGSAVRLFMNGVSTATHAFELDTSVGRLIKTVSKEPESDVFSLEFSTISDPTVSTLPRVSESHPAMVAVKMANDRPNQQPRPIGWLYVSAEAPYRYLYSSGKPDLLKDLASWDASLTFNGNSPPSDYAHFIMKNGDILCVVRGDLQGAASARQNPILYPAGDYNNPVVIDFGGRTKPTAWLQNCGADFLYNEDCFIFAEYTRPVHDRAYVWKVTYPLTNPDNWRIVQDFEVDVDVEHLHTISYDPFSGAVLLTSGDSDPESKILLSRDAGETWTVEFEGVEKYCRILNVIWTEDKIYWATDSGFPEKHSLFEATRDAEGFPKFDLESMKELFAFPYLSAQQATYTTAYIRDPHGLLFLDRHDWGGADQQMSIYFYDLDAGKMHVIADIKSLPGERYLGFRCAAVSWYQPEADDRIVCGFNLGLNPNVIDLLGNKATATDRVNNLALRVNRE